MNLERRILNLGCGPVYQRDALNVDAVERTACDLLASGRSLPFADGVFAELRASSVLEPLGYLGAVEALAECYRVLEPGGQLHVEIRDAETILQQLLEAAPAPLPPEQLPRLVQAAAQGPALFSAAWLQQLLARSGFEQIRVEPGAPTASSPRLRLTARRGPDPLHLALARLRSRVRELGLHDGLSATAGLELEEEFYGRLLQLPQLPVSEAQTTILELVARSAEATRVALALFDDSDVVVATELSALRRVADVASAGRLQELMWAALHRFMVTATLVDDPHGQVLELARTLLEELLLGWRGDPARLEQEFSQRVAPFFRGHSFATAAAAYHYLPTRGPFLRTRTGAAATQILARSLKHLERDQLPLGRLGLHLAVNLRQDPLTPLWNLAILQARLGNLERAISFYRSARLQTRQQELLEVLAQEEAACFAALDQPGAVELRVRPVPLGAAG